MRAADARHDALDVEGAIALLRQALRVDPRSFLAHYRYIQLMITEGAHPELRREYGGRASGGEDPLFTCLAIHVSQPSGYPQGDREPMLELDRRVAGSACTRVLIALGDPAPRNAAERARKIEEGRAALEVAPEIAELWRYYAMDLARVGRFDDGAAALRRGLRAASGFERVGIFVALAEIRTLAGDTAGAESVRRALAVAVERDRRSGVRFEFLRATSAPGGEEAALRERVRLAHDTAGAFPYEWAASLALGTFLSDAGRPVEALAPIERSVFLAESAGRPLLALVSYRQRGRTYSKMGRLADAEADLRHAIEIGESIDEPYQLAEVYHNLAHVYEGAGRLNEAEAAATRFVTLTRPMRESQPRMMSLHDAGVIRWKAGWHAAANEAFAEMVHVVAEQDRNHYWAGEFLERSGDYREALAHYRRGEETDAHERSLNLGGMARVYRALGIADSAEAAARAHDAALTNQLDVPMLPRMLVEAGRTDAAVAAARAWADRREGAGHVQGATLARIDLADILLAASRPREAAAEADRAATFARRLNLTDELIRAERLGGSARWAAGDTAGGLALLQRARARAEAHPSTEALLDTRLALAEALAAAGDAGALAHYDQAARVVERVTGVLQLDVDRARYRERHLAPFDGAIRFLLRAPTDGPAAERILDWSGRRKAAALALAGAAAGRPAVRPPDAATIRRSLAADEALVEYVILDDVAAAVVVTRDRASLVRLSFRSDSLHARALRLRRPLATTFGGRVDLARAPFDLALAYGLYQDVVAPLLPRIGDATRLTIAPDGPLHLIPFEALPVAPPRDDYTGARYVIDRWEVAYVPSADFATGDRGPVAARGAPLLAVAGNVPGGDRELAAIRAAWGAGAVRALTGAGASEAALAREAGGRGVLHFAVHARADDRDPLASHLRLAPAPGSDGYLHAGEIAALPGGARLVVLSGCETVAGPLYAGEGRMGLARAFLARGARAVVATDWPVGPATADVMAGFYRGLAEGRRTSEALREARLALRRDPDTAHPFYWGGFVLLLGS